MVQRIIPAAIVYFFRTGYKSYVISVMHNTVTPPISNARYHVLRGCPKGSVSNLISETKNSYVFINLIKIYTLLNI